MRKHFFLKFIVLASVLFVGCHLNNTRKIEETSRGRVLKTTFKSHFLIGTAVNRNQIVGRDSSAIHLLEREFSSITPENVMKSMNIHPKRDVFNFEIADKYVELGKNNDMFIVGHTLVWHSQLSEFFTGISNKDTLEVAMREHIDTIVGRYAQKINGWDVVNEALNEDGSLRESIFHKVIGPEYLVKSFKWAAEADPNAELYYNDYNLCVPSKRNGAVELIKMLQQNGCKVDGIGMQGHWGLEYPTLEEIEKSILTYSELGVKVMITELDITVLPNPWDLEGADVNQNFQQDPKMNPYTNGMPDSLEAKFNKRYRDIFSLFLKHSDKISRVTFWGINDGQSWLNNWPINGRTNYPLLFDRKFRPKPAYHEVLETVKGNQTNK